MNESLTNLSGWIPAIVLPTAALIQLIKLVQTRSSEGVSLMTWLLFGFADIGLYVFTEKYAAPQSIIGMLGTAILSFIVVALILCYRKGRNSTPDFDQG